MGYYHLTEAYLDLHNPRKAEENKMFYDNIRFVDYLSQTDIQEVAESIIWEFVDYGNTLNESFDIIMESLSDDKVDIFLDEATVTHGHDTKGWETRVPRGVTTGSGRQSYGPLKGRDTKGQVDAASRAARRKERVSRIVGATRKAAADVRDTTKGAVKSASSAVGSAVDKTVNRAKAALRGLLRSGARAAIGAGRNLERSGRAAERTTAVYGPGYGRGGSDEPISTRTSGGAKRRDIGGALKSVGRMLKGKKSEPQKPSQPTRSGSADLARIKGSLAKLKAKREDPWNQPFTAKTKSQEEPTKQKQQKSLPAPKQQKLLPPGKARSAPPIPPLPTQKPRVRVIGTRPAVKYAQAALPPAGQTSAPRQPVKSAGQRRAAQREILSQKREAESATKQAKIRRAKAEVSRSRAAVGSVSSRTSGALPPVGGSSRTSTGSIRPETRRRGALEKAAGRGAKATAVLQDYNRIRNRAKTRGVNEDTLNSILDLIVEDILSNGYVHDYDSALNMLESFSTETLYDLIESYDNQF